MIWVLYFMMFIALQGVVLSIILIFITPPKKRMVNWLFSILMIVISLYLLSNSQHGLPRTHPRVFLFSDLFIYAYTPLFYLLLLALFDDLFRPSKKYLVLFLPGLLYIIVITKYLIMPTAPLVKLLHTSDMIDVYLADTVALGINIFLIYKCWLLLKRNKAQLQGNQPMIMNTFIGLILISNLIWAMLTINHLKIGLQFTFVNHFTHWLSMSFMTFSLMLFFIIRSDFFRQHLLKKSYKSLPMEDSVITKITTSIAEVMKGEKPFVNPEFTLNELADLSGIKKYKLSMFINYHLKTTFFDLINSYRIEEFLRLSNLKEHKTTSLIGIASSAGFKSKSTFYKAFKDQKGQSPKEYLKSKNSSYYGLDNHAF